MSKNKHRKKHRTKKPSPEIVTGPIFLTAKGVGFIKEDHLPEDVRIPNHLLNTALHNDIVEVSLTYKKRGERVQGKVVKIIQRAKTQFVGTIQSDGINKYFVPDDKKVYVNFELIRNENFKKVTEEQKVVVEMRPWNDPNKNPIGEITKILGYKGEHETEMQAIIYEKGFSLSFPANVEKEAQKIKEMAPSDFEKELQKRISVPDGPPSTWDFRNTTTFTIDPFDAKDFDDALSFKDLGNGTYEVGIHIADVTHYVKEGSAIDKEAIKRGTSIYLVDRTIPMLPEVLSNDLCSLNPNEDKLAFSAVFILNDKCEVQERWFGEHWGISLYQ